MENKEKILTKKRNLIVENKEECSAKQKIYRERKNELRPIKPKIPSKKEQKEYRQLSVFKFTGHTFEYFTNNKEEVRDSCKLKADDLREKQNRALLEAKEKFKLESPKPQSLKCIEITDEEFENIK